jgi:hypothetical protein
LSDRQLDAFLGDLTALTLKHGVVITGCGCCASPRMYALLPFQTTHVYHCDEYGGNIDFRKMETTNERT